MTLTWSYRNGGSPQSAHVQSANEAASITRFVKANSGHLRPCGFQLHDPAAEQYNQ